MFFLSFHKKKQKKEKMKRLNELRSYSHAVSDQKKTKKRKFKPSPWLPQLLHSYSDRNKAKSERNRSRPNPVDHSLIASRPEPMSKRRLIRVMDRAVRYRTRCGPLWSHALAPTSATYGFILAVTPYK